MMLAGRIGPERSARDHSVSTISSALAGGGAARPAAVARLNAAAESFRRFIWSLLVVLDLGAAVLRVGERSGPPGSP